MDANEATRRLVEYYNSSRQMTASSLRQRISALQECLARLSDTPESDRKADESKSVVDQAIDALGKREVGPRDRGRLRGALDKADAPPAGKDRGNEAIGRMASRR